MVPVDSRRVSRAPRYSGTRARVQSAFAYMAITSYGRFFQIVRLAAGLVTLRFCTGTRPTTPSAPLRSRTSNSKSQRNAGFGLFRFRSPLLTESLLLSFPPGTEMVHFPGLARTRLCIQRAVSGFFPEGFPHSEIPGSKGASPSPRLFAGSRVLHRRLAPRHPPYALSSLTIKSAQHTLGNEQLKIEDCRLNRLLSPSFNRTIAQSPDHSMRGCAAQIRLLLIPPDFDPGGTNTRPGPQGPELVDTALSVFKDR